MNIEIGDRKYRIIKEYSNYYLCDYRGLYKTCFLKTDVLRGNLNDNYSSCKHVAYAKQGYGVSKKLKEEWVYGTRRIFRNRKTS